MHDTDIYIKPGYVYFVWLSFFLNKITNYE